MASAQKQSANVDLFDAYFGRADLDRDGRISGNEAVAFFQGSGLPKQVLAQGVLCCSIFDGAVRDALFQQCYQDLYKSRCDNRLTEITERASADKYEEKKMELNRAVVKMEQEGDSDAHFRLATWHPRRSC
ncbi:uncharacterized protein LOC103928117 isoform X11 [Pyrus x bretschneideri]|uniref:uncharacterized protein LOC103928117 isoform X11 n=1 Tax=Pyrus x bretschneideri TaxID=225117 RepID=UPI002030CFF1|nr:uncharacterized protein LOC103928117 isoform X11 [Pyrus x bretschneideri]